MYRERKTATKMVRSMSWQNSLESRAAGQEQLENIAVSVDRDRARHAVKQSLANVPRFFRCARSFRHFVDGLLRFPELEFHGNFLVLSSNAQPKHITRLLFMEPALQSARHFPAVPVEDHVPCAQTGLRRESCRLHCPYNPRTTVFMIREEAKRGLRALGGMQLQPSETENFSIRKRLGAGHVFL